MTLRWKKYEKDVWVSSTVKVWSRFTERNIVAIFRVDGSDRARSGYRADRGGIMGWEAIDGGRGFATASEAKAYVERYVAAMHEQTTLTPRIERDPRRSRRSRKASRRPRRAAGRRRSRRW